MIQDFIVIAASTLGGGGVMLFFVKRLINQNDKLHQDMKSWQIKQDDKISECREDLLKHKLEGHK